MHWVRNVNHSDHVPSNNEGASDFLLSPTCKIKLMSKVPFATYMSMSPRIRIPLCHSLYLWPTHQLECAPAELLIAFIARLLLVTPPHNNGCQCCNSWTVLYSQCFQSTDLCPISLQYWIYAYDWSFIISWCWRNLGKKDYTGVLLPLLPWLVNNRMICMFGT